MFDTRAKNDSRTSVIVTLASLGRQTHTCAKIIFVSELSLIFAILRNFRVAGANGFICARWANIVLFLSNR